VKARFQGPPPGAATVELEVPFHDVDGLHVVWHGHYLKYLELARTVLLRARGLDGQELIDLGVRFFVAEYHLRHVYALRYMDRVRVSAWLLEAENRIRIAYHLDNLTTGKPAAQAWTVLVTTRADGELCLETPPPVLERLRAPGPGALAGRTP
jgi:acyl-CoA thioester hydrolase